MVAKMLILYDANTNQIEQCVTSLFPKDYQLSHLHAHLIRAILHLYY